MNQNTTSARRVRAHLSEFTLNQIHLRSPLIVSFWSIFTPGLGSLTLDRKIKGFILIFWGILVNTNGKINMAIVDSLTGHFERSKDILDQRWLLLYFAVYIYSAWDTYRGAVELNKIYILADREDAPLKPFTIKTLDVNVLDKRSPLLAAVWSMLMPGLGNLYLHRSIEGIFFVAWTLVVMYYSNCLQAIHYTFVLDFNQAKTALNVQWFLYLPSIYVFQIYDCYTAAVEGNKLFEKEQSRWLRDHYQKIDFSMPI